MPGSSAAHGGSVNRPVTNRNNPLASCPGGGRGPVRHPLRHWLRSVETWQALAGAQLTHPRRVAAAARRHGISAHWHGRVRVWSWRELELLVELEAERRASEDAILRGFAARLRRAGR